MRRSRAATRIPSPSAARWPRWALRALLLAPVVWLALFHAALLGRRLADQSLLDPVIGLKWLISAALLGALPLARRAGIRLAEPRRAAALGVLVLLLHLALPTAPVAALPVGEMPAPLGWALLAITPAAFGLAAIAICLLARRPAPAAAPSGPWGRLPDGQRDPWRDRAAVHLFSRPPPVFDSL